MWLLVLAALAFASSVRPGSPDPGPVGPAPDEGGARRDDMLARLASAGLSADWVRFLDAAARRESRWNPAASLGPTMHPGRPPWAPASRASMAAQAGEARAARRAYDRRDGRVGGIGLEPRDRWTWGSSGWWGLLPPYAAQGWADVLGRVVDPWELARASDAQVLAAVEYARRIAGWPQYRRDPSWAQLRVGWAAPSLMGPPSSWSATARAVVARLAEDARATTGTDAWLSDEPPPLPSRADLAAWYRARNGEDA